MNSVSDTSAAVRANVPTNPYNNSTGKGTDISSLLTSHVINGTTQSFGEDGVGKAIEIRYGTDDSIFELTDVYIDYIKAP